MPDRILVVDLLGGLGDLVMVLPVVHALAQRYPDAPLTLLTHEPGADLVRDDPAVACVRVAPRGWERSAVAAALDAEAPDLVVTTTRHSGIPDEIAACGVHGVTDLWRRPPADQPVSTRYLDVLAAEGVVATRPGADVPRLHLGAADRRDGAHVLDAAAGTDVPPVVLVPGVGMAVKRWPYWAALADTLGSRPVLAVTGHSVPGARPLPALPLRVLAGVFAAVGDAGGVVVGGDTGPMRVAAAAGAATVGLFGPTTAARYGLPGGTGLQGLPGCPHRRPTAITEQECWWEACCPLATTGPACMADIGPHDVAAAVHRALDRHDAGLARAPARDSPTGAAAPASGPAADS